MFTTFDTTFYGPVGSGQNWILKEDGQGLRLIWFYRGNKDWFTYFPKSLTRKKYSETTKQTKGQNFPVVYKKKLLLVRWIENCEWK